MDDITGSFVEEVRELLLQLEDDLIGLEKNPGNGEVINNIFRLMHTLKGSAGMVGFKNIQDLTHEFEEVYEQIREGLLKVNPEIIDYTLQGKDVILSMLTGNDDPGMRSDLINSIRSILIQKQDPSIAKPPAKLKDEKLSRHLYVILFAPDKDVFERGLDPDKILNEIKSTGETYILSHEKMKSWKLQKKEKKCHTSWEIYLGAFINLSQAEEYFLFYDQDEFQIFEIPIGDLPTDSKLINGLQRLYKNKVDPEKHLRDCISHLTESEINQNPPFPHAEIKELVNTQSVDQVKTDIDSTVNVSSHKLDELMNLVSELVTTTATIELHASKYKDLKLNNALESIEKLTKQFRNNALDLRMVPIGTLLTKFKRQVRDLSKDLKKNVNLIIEGQDIEIDKTILKSIESPLQHIIRNSIDHGLEPEEERISKGKPAECILKITVFYSGASVIIQVQDDGRGINLEKVKECAIKKGIIQVDQVVTKQELINLILEPGFSTSENVSMVSGRGVGMDVVKRELNIVGGSLEVFTENNLGTSITMKLPTTLTIIDTLLVDVGNTQILIPVMDIEYCFKESNDSLFKKDNKYIQFKNNLIPLVSLHKEFKYPESFRQEMMVIVINKFDRKYAITADRIVGEHQAVIKPLGDLFRNQPLFSGGSIMVDGKLALILDTNFLFNNVTKN